MTISSDIANGLMKIILAVAVVILIAMALGVILDKICTRKRVENGCYYKSSLIKFESGRWYLSSILTNEETFEGCDNQVSHSLRSYS